ncbi:MAG: superoxide dismutase [Syntrophomonadaceae bacterium]|nr:superoxide dismutase [Syntrophomonadaceae bacterium]
MTDRIVPKTYDLRGFPGFSHRQLSEHYTLYVGYVNKLNEIHELLKDVDYSKANQTYSDLRSLKIGENFALNGIKLHEAYFENLSPGQQISGRIEQTINATFGSYENFHTQFSACGLAARGWVLLSLNLDWGNVVINCLDAHDVGYYVNTYPLLVMDVYEHAYMIDYGIKRADYISAFMQNIAWEVVNRRLEQVLSMLKR